MADPPPFEGISTESDLIEWSRAYCKTVRRDWGVTVRFDLVEWEVSTRAKRRAAAVKHPRLSDATTGEPYDWTTIDGAEGRPLPCTLSLSLAAFESFSRTEWEATLRHELIHVEQFQRDGTTGHGPAFRDRARELDTERHCETFVDPAYVFTCGQCGEEVAYRYRECKLVRQVDQYHSECCSAGLELFQPTPGEETRVR